MKYILIIISIIIISGIIYERDLMFNKKETIEIVNSNSILNQNPDIIIGDKVKYDVIIKSKDKDLKLDISKIETEINIKEIQVNGETKSISEINENILKKDDIVTILGDSKINGEINKENIEIKEELEKQIEEIEQEEEKKLELPLEEKKVEEITFQKLNFSSNINNLIEINGTNLDKINFITIGEISHKLTSIDGNKGYILINKGTYNSGSFFVIVNYKSGEIINLKDLINFEYDDSNISVAQITPNKISNKNDTQIILQGEGFSKVITIQLSNNIVLKEANFNIINDNVLSVKIPKNIQKGVYKLNIMDTSGIYKINKNITID